MTLYPICVFFYCIDLSLSQKPPKSISCMRRPPCHLALVDCNKTNQRQFTAVDIPELTHCDVCLFSVTKWISVRRMQSSRIKVQSRRHLIATKAKQNLQAIASFENSSVSFYMGDMEEDTSPQDRICWGKDRCEVLKNSSKRSLSNRHLTHQARTVTHTSHFHIYSNRVRCQLANAPIEQKLVSAGSPVRKGSENMPSSPTRNKCCV